MNKKLTQAFTMIELLAVMVIILVIAGLFVGVSGPASQSAKKRKAEVMISALEVAIGMYHADTGAYPVNTGSTWIIDSLKDDPGVDGWSGPYMQFKHGDYQDQNPDTKIILDPWGNLYNYVTPGTNNTNSFDLWSKGPDGVEGDAAKDKDNIVNW